LQVTGPVSIFDLAPEAITHEQPTALYQRPPGGNPDYPPQPDIVVHASETWAEPGSITSAPTALYPPRGEGAPRDWLAIILGVLAVVALLGLIPLWYFVYQAYQ
jgi:hypothetical protein